MASRGEHKELVRRFVDEVINQRNYSVVDELVSDRSTDMAQETLSRFAVIAAFPDFRVYIERMIAEGNRVAVVSTYAGTHQNAFLGLKPSGRMILGRGVDIYTLEDSKITGIEYNYDVIEIVNQLSKFPKEAVFAGQNGA